MNYIPNIDDIKQLRNLTSCGPLACKEALTAKNGSIDEAIKYLREKYAASFAKRSGNLTTEGSFAISHGQDNHKHEVCVILELLCESSSAASSEEFKDLIHKIAKLMVSHVNFRQNIQADPSNFMTHLEPIDHHLHGVVLKLRENIKIGRVKVFNVEHCVVYHYIHESGNNKIFAAVKVKNKITEDFRLAAHVCYAAPLALEPRDITKEMIQDCDAKNANELALNTQRYFFNQKSTIKDLLEDNEVIDFVRFKIGE